MSKKETNKAKKSKPQSQVSNRAIVKRMNEVLAEFNPDPKHKIKVTGFTIEAAMVCELPCVRVMVTQGGRTWIECQDPDGNPCG